MKTVDGRPPVLVAGIGNVLLGDDGFGAAVVARLRVHRLPASVAVVDYGVRGVDLVYDLVDGYVFSLILIDALSLDEAPGTIALLDAEGAERLGPAAAWHSITPADVLSALAAHGAPALRLTVVGCQPGAREAGKELSEAVAGALDAASHLVVAIARSEANLVMAACERRVAMNSPRFYSPTGQHSALARLPSRRAGPRAYDHN